MVNGQFIHYLDDQPFYEPGKFEEFAEELERSFDLRLVAVQYPNTVVFNSGAYAYLRNAYEQNLCISFKYRCEFVCGGLTYVVARGQVNISDIEWNLNKCEANTKIADDGFGARIANNKSIKVSMEAETSKNGVSIGPCPHIDLGVFVPADPEPDYLPNEAIAYDWLEALNHIVRFITDDAIQVESPWYDALPEDERFSIVLGRELRRRDGTSEPVQTSFSKHFEDMWRKYNLWAVVTRATDGSPVLSIIQDEATYSATVSKALPWQDDLEQSVDLDRMYSSVSLGDEDYFKDENSDAYVLPFLPMASFRPEEYFIAGTCNTDSQLVLTGNYFYDTNAINKCRGGGQDYDDKIALVQYTVYLSRATKGDYLFPGNPPYLYNEALLNINVANRWRLQADGVTNYEAQQANFWAERTAIISNPIYTSNPGNGAGADTQLVLQFDDDFTPPLFDNDNAWGNGTTQGTPVSSANSRYTAPSVGYYIFDGGGNWELISNTIGAQSGTTICRKMGWLRITVERYNIGNVLIGSVDYDSDPQEFPGVYQFSFTHTTLLDASDYLIVNSTLMNGPVSAVCPEYPLFASAYELRSQLAGRCFFKTSFVAVGGGVITGSDADEYRTINYKFKRHIAIEDWVSLRDQPTSAVEVAVDNSQFRICHAQKISRNILTGETDWEMVANRNQQFK